MDKEIFINSQKIIVLEEVPNEEFDAWLKTDDKNEGYEEFLARMQKEITGQESKIILDDELLVQEKLQAEKEEMNEIKGAKFQTEMMEWNEKFLAWENETQTENCMDKENEKSKNVK